MLMGGGVDSSGVGGLCSAEPGRRRPNMLACDMSVFHCESGEYHQQDSSESLQVKLICVHRRRLGVGVRLQGSGGKHWN